MAFSNLWSTERFSFSLSVVAVITAAITTYHQFYNNSTEISSILHSNMTFPKASGQFRNDTIAFECTFLNSGVTPVGLIESRMFLTHDSAFEFQNSAHGDYESYRTFQTNNRIWNQKGYFPPNSVMQLSFVTTIDSSKLSRLVLGAPRNSIDPDHVLLRAGIWLRMVDPYGNESSDVRAVGVFYDTKSLGPGVYGIPVGKKQMPPFREPEYN